VVRIFHLALRRIARHSDIVMRSYQQTSALPRQKLTDRFNFRWACLLLCDHVIQTKNHHRIGVTKDLVVQWQALTRLVNPLVNYDGMSRSLTDDVLKPHGRQVK
jgi:hypothetical protein